MANETLFQAVLKYDHPFGNRFLPTPLQNAFSHEQFYNSPYALRNKFPIIVKPKIQYTAPDSYPVFPDHVLRNTAKLETARHSSYPKFFFGQSAYYIRNNNFRPVFPLQPTHNPVPKYEWHPSLLSSHFPDDHVYILHLHWENLK